MRNAICHPAVLKLLLLLVIISFKGTASLQGAYPRLQASFELPQVTGSPFDYAQNDVQVTFDVPSHERVVVPAFFDGGSTWRVRFTPEIPGHYSIGAIAINGREIAARNLDKRDFVVSGQPARGFVRLDANRKGFIFDSGERYYPLGCNVGWSSRGLDVPGHLARLGEAGVNWSRIWMCHFDGRNLDWDTQKRMPFGELSLEAAAKWDAAVETANRKGIFFQMVLQHHGQYSTRTDPSWRHHPWNKAKGGWLTSASEFFTDPRAIALTRAKYRYIVARWGYSPAIMAWELFNEVQYVDAMRDRPEAVTRWHADMAAFIRQQDRYHHLVTTSSDLALNIWRDMDYYQAHTYPPEALSGIAALAGRDLDKPFFIGETGPAPMGSIGLGKDDGSFLHQVLWAGLMSPMAGAAQIWEWDTVHNNNLYSHFTAASGFLKSSGMAAATEMRPLDAAVETTGRGALRFAPVAGWGIGNRAEITVYRNGEVPGIKEMQTLLHGANHKAFPSNYTFHVDYLESGTFTATIGSASKNGARLTLGVDGVPLAQHEFQRTEKDTRAKVSLTTPIPAGKHTVTLCNAGMDWVLLNGIELSPYAPALSVIGKSKNDFAVFWVHRSGDHSNEVTGTLVAPGFAPGDYTATWWDTYEGKSLSEVALRVAPGKPLRLATPAIRQDAALWIRRVRPKVSTLELP